MRSSQQPFSLPGFYWDPEKRRFFKNTGGNSGGGAANPATATTPVVEERRLPVARSASWKSAPNASEGRCGEIINISELLSGLRKFGWEGLQKHWRTGGISASKTEWETLLRKSCVSSASFGCRRLEDSEKGIQLSAGDVAGDTGNHSNSATPRQTESGRRAGEEAYYYRLSRLDRLCCAAVKVRGQAAGDGSRVLTVSGDDRGVFLVSTARMGSRRRIDEDTATPDDTSSPFLTEYGLPGQSYSQETPCLNLSQSLNVGRQSLPSDDSSYLWTSGLYLPQSMMAMISGWKVCLAIQAPSPGDGSSFAALLALANLKHCGALSVYKVECSWRTSADQEGRPVEEEERHRMNAAGQRTASSWYVDLDSWELRRWRNGDWVSSGPTDGASVLRVKPILDSEEVLQGRKLKVERSRLTRAFAPEPPEIYGMQFLESARFEGDGGGLLCLGGEAGKMEVRALGRQRASELVWSNYSNSNCSRSDVFCVGGLPGPSGETRNSASLFSGHRNGRVCVWDTRSSQMCGDLSRSTSGAAIEGASSVICCKVLKKTPFEFVVARMNGWIEAVDVRRIRSSQRAGWESPYGRLQEEPQRCANSNNTLTVRDLLCEYPVWRGRTSRSRGKTTQTKDMAKVPRFGRWNHISHGEGSTSSRCLRTTPHSSGILRVFENSTCNSVKEWQMIEVDDDEDLLATVCCDEGVVRIWDLKQGGRPLQTVKVVETGMQSIRCERGRFGGGDCCSYRAHNPVDEETTQLHNTTNSRHTSSRDLATGAEQLRGGIIYCKGTGGVRGSGPIRQNFVRTRDNRVAQNFMSGGLKVGVYMSEWMCDGNKYSSPAGSYWEGLSKGAFHVFTDKHVYRVGL